MRNILSFKNADALSYEIREIVKVANALAKKGIQITWENIGDPVAKGERIAPWIRDIVIDAIKEDPNSFGYSPTKGVLATREFIAAKRNQEGGAQITPEDILFFNGLGDAIATLYNCLHSEARIIGPTPIYPAHASSEAAHAGKPVISFPLDPENHWHPDLSVLEKQILKYPDVSGILIVNPDNPTGFVYPKNSMQEIVALARKYKLFVIADEVYANLCYDAAAYTSLASVVGDVPGIALRGISKEFPWPGARSGWIEFYNASKDPDFSRYAQTLVNAKMLEVCATTLPQIALPKIMNDPRYNELLKQRKRQYEERAELACAAFSRISGISVQKPQGAFYLTVVFEEGVLLVDQSLLAISNKAFGIIKPLLQKTRALDKRFVYYLLAHCGICVVPLSSGFYSRHHGFRMTLLDPDNNAFEKTIDTLARAIRKYLTS